MKKERNPIVVAFCMIFLLLMIILPPFFRTLIPKEEVREDTKSKNNIQILKCYIEYAEKSYKETASVKYVNNKIVQNIISYQFIGEKSSVEEQGDSGNLPNDSNSMGDNLESDTTDETTGYDNPSGKVQTEEEESTDFTLLSDEYRYLSSLNDINIRKNKNTTTITINQNSIKDNADDMKLVNYFQSSIKKQQDFYENLGYTCNQLKS